METRYVSLSVESTALLARTLDSLPRDIHAIDWAAAASMLRSSPVEPDIQRSRQLLWRDDFFILKLDTRGLGQHGVWGSQVAARLVAHLLGRVAPQNEAGDIAITVYNRNARDRQNPRYTQTSRGGLLHTDRASSPDPWNCMLLACLAPAMLGGETVLVPVDRLYAFLAGRFPGQLAVLEREFQLKSKLFPGREYAAPVFQTRSGRTSARYLRMCIDAGAEAQGTELGDEQINALDVLDASVELAELQIRFRLGAGEILIALDERVLHGRTAFADAPGAIPAVEAAQHDHRPLKRTMERLWVDLAC
jgi:hypothetical protein